VFYPGKEAYLVFLVMCKQGLRREEGGTVFHEEKWREEKRQYDQARDA